MGSVGCKRTNAVRRNNKGQISDWIGTSSGIISSPVLSHTSNFPSRCSHHLTEGPTRRAAAAVIERDVTTGYERYER
jgi:hypothetical protein